MCTLIHKVSRFHLSASARGSFFKQVIHKIDNFGNAATGFIKYMVLYRIYKMPHVKSRVVARRSARKVPWKAQRQPHAKSRGKSKTFTGGCGKLPRIVPAEKSVFVVIVEVTGTGC